MKIICSVKTILTRELSVEFSSNICTIKLRWLTSGPHRHRQRFNTRNTHVHQTGWRTGRPLTELNSVTGCHRLPFAVVVTHKLWHRTQCISEWSNQWQRIVSTAKRRRSPWNSNHPENRSAACRHQFGTNGVSNGIIYLLSRVLRREKSFSFHFLVFLIFFVIKR